MALAAAKPAAGVPVQSLAFPHPSVLMPEALAFHRSIPTQKSSMSDFPFQVQTSQNQTPVSNGNIQFASPERLRISTVQSARTTQHGCPAARQSFERAASMRVKVLTRSNIA